MTTREPFAPWRRLFQVAALLLVAGGAVVYYAVHTSPMPLAVLLVGFGFLGLGGLFMRSALVRWTGKQVEQSSIRNLRLPAGWQLRPNYPSPAGGDVDLYVESPDGDGYAIEIKAVEGVTIKHAFLGLGTASLLGPNGRKLKDDPIPQTLRNAEVLSATPVLWLPRCSGKTTTLAGGVIVVLGPRKRLLKAIGAPTGWSFF